MHYAAVYHFDSCKVTPSYKNPPSSSNPFIARIAALLLPPSDGFLRLLPPDSQELIPDVWVLETEREKLLLLVGFVLAWLLTLLSTPDMTMSSLGRSAVASNRTFDKALELFEPLRLMALFVQTEDKLSWEAAVKMVGLSSLILSLLVSLASSKGSSGARFVSDLVGLAFETLFSNMLEDLRS